MGSTSQQRYWHVGVSSKVSYKNLCKILEHALSGTSGYTPSQHSLYKLVHGLFIQTVPLLLPISIFPTVALITISLYKCLLPTQRLIESRPVGRGGSRGFARTPPFGLQKILNARLTVHFNCTFQIDPLASMILRITAVKTSLVAAMRLGSRRTSAERACVSCLRRCDERTRVNTRA